MPTLHITMLDIIFKSLSIIESQQAEIAAVLLNESQVTSIVRDLDQYAVDCFFRTLQYSTTAIQNRAPTLLPRDRWKR